MYFNIATGMPISHKKATNLPIPLDLPDQIHALTAKKLEDFIILENHGNPFVVSDDLFDASSVDTESVEVETVDDDDDTSFDSEDSSSNNESENSGESDRRSSKEWVNAIDRRENEE